MLTCIELKIAFHCTETFLTELYADLGAKYTLRLRVCLNSKMCYGSPQLRTGHLMTVLHLRQPWNGCFMGHKAPLRPL